MQTLFLIGKTGQLGEALLTEAALQGFAVAGFSHSELEVTDEAAVRREVERARPEYIINTAAFHSVPACENNPLEALRVNCVAVRNLAKIAKEYGAKFVTFSTDYVFDGEKGAPYLEDDRPKPLQFYGVSKLCGEYAALNEFPDGTYIIRTSGLFGGKEGSKSKAGGNLVLKMLRDAAIEDKVEVSSEQIVSPTYAGDLGRAVLQLLQKNDECGIYHLVNEGWCGWHEFVREIYRLRSIKREVIPVDRGGFSDGVRRPKFSALQNRKAAALGIKLPSWQEGLAAYLAFLAELRVYQG